MNYIYQNIANRRKSLGVSQSAVSRLTRIPRQTYRDIENGISEPKIGALLSICDALKCPLSEFVESAALGDDEKVRRLVVQLSELVNE
ncbi:helix-turn-helix domain-containing protein [Vibrio astriarenae]